MGGDNSGSDLKARAPTPSTPRRRPQDPNLGASGDPLPLTTANHPGPPPTFVPRQGLAGRSAAQLLPSSNFSSKLPLASQTNKTKQKKAPPQEALRRRRCAPHRHLAGMARGAPRYPLPSPTAPSVSRPGSVSPGGLTWSELGRRPSALRETPRGPPKSPGAAPGGCDPRPSSRPP